MSSFTEAKLIDTGKKREGRNIYRVVNDFYWEMGYQGSGLRIYARAGYETDGPSRPTAKSKGMLSKLVGIALNVIPQKVWGLAVVPSIIHDVLREDDRFTKEEGDAVFWLCLLCNGMPKFWADRFFDGVRSNFNRERHNSDEIVKGLSRGVSPGFVVTVAR